MELLRHQTTILELNGITQLQMVVAITNDTWILNQQSSFYVPIYRQIHRDLRTKFRHLSDENRHLSDGNNM